MKDFPVTKQFVADINFLCAAIFKKEFFTEGFFYNRGMEIYRTYAWSESHPAWDERELVRDFLDNVDVQSKEGLQDAFDLWKLILNGINLPDCDLLMYGWQTRDMGAHSKDGLAIWEWLVDVCGSVRLEVEKLTKEYELLDRCSADHFLVPGYYPENPLPHDTSKSEPTTKTRKHRKVKTFSEWLSEGVDMEKLREKYVGTHGRDKVRDLLLEAIGANCSKYPSFEVLKEAFPDVIGRSEYYEVTRQLKPSKKVEKFL